MTEAVVFETPGLLDLKSVMTFGINVKKGANPIGYFGTGLKYAIAVLVRENISVTIYVGPKEYVFYKKQEDFRGKEFDFVMMKQRNSLLGRWTSRQMPFTTEFGKNWELWQAFRELESNTRDEGGQTRLIDPTQHVWDNNTTRIVVEGLAFRKIWEARDTIFLPEADTVYDATTNIQVIKKPTRAVYYRGLKVMELEKPAKLTYNVLAPVQLTEDRTVKYDWDIRDRIMRYICCDCKDQQIIHEVVTADEKETWEGSFPFDQLWSDPSELFMSVIRRKLARTVGRATSALSGSAYVSRGVSPRVARLYESKIPEPPKVKEPVNEYIDKLKNWILVHGLSDLHPTLVTDLARVIQILQTHHDYEEVQVVMVPKNQPTATVDEDIDIPF